MRSLRRQPNLVRALLLAAAVTLLPPGAWSLCLDRAGHVAIEPTAADCGDGERPGADAGDACGAGTHDACEDYVLLHGQFSTATAASHDPAPAAIASAVPGAAAIPLARTPGRVALRSHAPPPPGTAAVLRC